MNDVPSHATMPRGEKPLVLVGRLVLQPLERLYCFARECGREIQGKSEAFFFRRRTRGGMHALVYCATCGTRASYDLGIILLYRPQEGPDGSPVTLPSRQREVADPARLRPLVLVGKVTLREGGALGCVARGCETQVGAGETAWMFRTRACADPEPAVYCTPCKDVADYDAIYIHLYERALRKDRTRRRGPRLPGAASGPA